MVQACSNGKVFHFKSHLGEKGTRPTTLAKRFSAVTNVQKKWKHASSSASSSSSYTLQAIASTHGNMHSSWWLQGKNCTLRAQDYNTETNTSTS
jgi:hypothetical protein